MKVAVVAENIFYYSMIHYLWTMFESQYYLDSIKYKKIECWMIVIYFALEDEDYEPAIDTA